MAWVSKKQLSCVEVCCNAEGTVIKLEKILFLNAGNQLLVKLAAYFILTIDFVQV